MRVKRLSAQGKLEQLLDTARKPMLSSSTLRDTQREIMTILHRATMCCPCMQTTALISCGSIQVE
jgi:transposase